MLIFSFFSIKKNEYKNEPKFYEAKPEEDNSDDKIKAILEVGFIENPELEKMNPFIKQNNINRFESPSKQLNEDLIEEFDNVRNYLLTKEAIGPQLATTFNASTPFKDSLLGKEKINNQPQLVTTTVYNTSPGENLILNFGKKSKEKRK